MTEYWKKYWVTDEITKRNEFQEQVGRTINRSPIPVTQWEKTVEFIESHLNPSPGEVILDLCAGNGLLSVPISTKCSRVIAVDISQELLNNIDTAQYQNITRLQADVMELDLAPDSADKALLYFALQHFDLKETLILLEKCCRILKKGGVFYIGDIPDEDKIWDFYDTPERESAYFGSIQSGRPIIGQWFTRSFIRKAALFTGFESAVIIGQPSGQINAHYRFDALLTK